MFLPVRTRFGRAILSFYVALFAFGGAVESEAAEAETARNVMRMIRQLKGGPAAESVVKSESVEKRAQIQTQEIRQDKHSGPKQLAAGFARDGKCKLRYQMNRRADSIAYLACRHQATSMKEPPDLVDLPDDRPGNELYFTAEFGERKVHGVTYCSWYGMGQIKLCLDSDGDGRLSDEKAFVAKVITKRKSRLIMKRYRFGPIPLTFSDGQRNTQTRFYIETLNGRQLTFYPANYRCGRVRLDGRTYKVAIIDGDFDGRYDEVVSIPLEDVKKPKSDFFVIDLNHDGKLQWARDNSSYSEVTPLSKMVKVADSYYNINITPDGRSLDLEKTDPEFGALYVGKASLKLKLWSDAAHQLLDCSGKDGSCRRATTRRCL